jgi:hypothetical protein
MLASATGGDARAVSLFRRFEPLRPSKITQHRAFHHQDAFLSRLLALEDYHKFCEGMCLDTSRLKFSFLDLAALYAHELPESSDSWLRRAGLT